MITVGATGNGDSGSTKRAAAAPIRNRYGLLFKLFALAVAVEVAALSIVSHYVPLSLNLKPLVIAPGLIVVACELLRIVALSRQGLLSKLTLTAARKLVPRTFTVMAILVSLTSLTSDQLGNASSCPTGMSGTCYKTASWRIEGGRYYRYLPYDNKGNAISDAAWVQITEAQYLAGAGADFRQADSFGATAVFFACLAFAAETISNRREQLSPSTSLPTS